MIVFTHSPAVFEAWWLIASPTPIALPAYLARAWRRAGRPVVFSRHADAVALANLANGPRISVAVDVTPFKRGIEQAGRVLDQLVAATVTKGAA